jgi:branched-chain amino acid transport system permease protein
MANAVRTGPSTTRLLLVAVPILVLLGFLPRLVDPYQTVLLTYGLAMAIAALGFNLLLGYTGLLSFGHSAYFGAGAYMVAFIVRDLGVQSMELCILGGLIGTVLVAALFGFVCVRHTRIFFGILTLALSQVLWSLAYKFFWITGGTDGIRVAYAKLTLLGGTINFAGSGSTSGSAPTFMCSFSYLHPHHVGDRSFIQQAAGDPRQQVAPASSASVRRYRWSHSSFRSIHRPRRICGCRSTG